MPPNPFLLAADDDPSLLPLLRSTPGLASMQDAHGYSLVHAAASYDRLALLRALVGELGAAVDVRDEDGETALFVVESVAAARVLVEELGCDLAVRSRADDAEGMTAREKIVAEGEFPEVAEYLARVEAERRRAGAGGGEVNGTDGARGEEPAVNGHVEPVLPLELPPPPDGLTVTLGTTTEAVAGEGPAGISISGDNVSQDFQRRIGELTAREDFSSAEGQQELQRLIMEELVAQNLTGGAGQAEGEGGRNIRQRQD